MSPLFRFPDSVKREPAIETWMREYPDELSTIARRWFEVMRACVGDAAFAYVDAFKNHVNVGFFRGAGLPDPSSLLEGTGKSMRHVKLMPGRKIDEAALRKIIHAAYADMQRCLTAH